MPKVSSLAVFTAGNKILCDISYGDTVWSPLVTDTARLLNLSSPILDRSHVFRRRADENKPSSSVTLSLLNQANFFSSMVSGTIAD